MTRPDGKGGLAMMFLAQRPHMFEGSLQVRTHRGTRRGGHRGTRRGTHRGSHRGSHRGTHSGTRGCTRAVLKGYSRDTQGVLERYSRSTHGVLEGHSRGTRRGTLGVLEGYSRGTLRIPQEQMTYPGYAADTPPISLQSERDALGAILDRWHVCTYISICV